MLAMQLCGGFRAVAVFSKEPLFRKLDNHMLRVADLEGSADRVIAG
jgi:hypothetical protein